MNLTNKIMNNETRLQLVYQIFSPSAPIENEALFIGRVEQLQKIKDAIEERGQHVVMYGSRGAGKTSIANIVCTIFENVVTSKITCNRSDSFFSIWEKALKKITFESNNKTIGYTGTEKKAIVRLSLPEKEYIEPADIEDIFQSLNENVLIVFDEYDCIEDLQAKLLMADTLKMMSDNVPNITVMIVGIAESVDELIGEHPSLERCIKQIDVPLMSDEDAENMIANNMRILEMEMSEEIVDRIVQYSSGFPHYIHSLCKFAVMNAIEEESDEIVTGNFDYAVAQSIENSDHSLSKAFKLAVATSKPKNQFEDVIFASINAETDEYDSFSSEDVLEKYNSLTNKELKKESIVYNLGMLCKTERGVILEKVPFSGDTRYKFRNPLMKAYVKLRLHQK